MDSLLRGRHTDIDIHLIHREWDHGVGRDRVRDHDRAVCVGEGADLSDGVQDACSRLLMRRVDGGDVGVLFECPLYLGEIGKPVDGEL